MSKLSDPADKAFVDQFKTVTNRRAGYSADAFQRIMKCARIGGTLAAGEGQQIIEHFEDILFNHYVSDSQCRAGCEKMQVTKDHCMCWQDVRRMSPG